MAGLPWASSDPTSDQLWNTQIQVSLSSSQLCVYWKFDSETQKKVHNLTTYQTTHPIPLPAIHSSTTKLPLAPTLSQYSPLCYFSFLSYGAIQLCPRSSTTAFPCLSPSMTQFTFLGRQPGRVTYPFTWVFLSLSYAVCATVWGTMTPVVIKNQTLFAKCSPSAGFSS